MRILDHRPKSRKSNAPRSPRVDPESTVRNRTASLGPGFATGGFYWRCLSRKLLYGGIGWLLAAPWMCYRSLSLEGSQPATVANGQLKLNLESNLLSNLPSSQTQVGWTLCCSRAVDDALNPTHGPRGRAQGGNHPLVLTYITFRDFAYRILALYPLVGMKCEYGIAAFVTPGGTPDTRPPAQIYVLAS
jgi:hypothetical protein